jgi:site-specific recombinase XerC
VVQRISSPALPALVAAAGERASLRFLEFFAANIRNPHTRRAYARAAEEFLTWCADAGVPSIAAVQPVHVATWIEASTRELTAPSVKQRLAALRHLFDWLVPARAPYCDFVISNSTTLVLPVIGTITPGDLNVILLPLTRTK